MSYNSEAAILKELEDKVNEFRSDLEYSFDNLDQELARCNLLRRNVLIKNARVALKKLDEIYQESYYYILFNVSIWLTFISC